MATLESLQKEMDEFVTILHSDLQHTHTEINSLRSEVKQLSETLRTALSQLSQLSHVSQGLRRTQSNNSVDTGLCGHGISSQEFCAACEGYSQPRQSLSFSSESSPRGYTTPRPPRSFSSEAGYTTPPQSHSRPPPSAYGDYSYSQTRQPQTRHSDQECCRHGINTHVYCIDCESVSQRPH